GAAGRYIRTTLKANGVEAAGFEGSATSQDKHQIVGCKCSPAAAQNIFDANGGDGSQWTGTIYAPRWRTADVQGVAHPSRAPLVGVEVPTNTVNGAAHALAE